MPVTSTVPGAINALLGYMNSVAATNPALDISVHLGEPIVNVNDNFMAVGSFQDWAPVAPDTYSWATIPGAAKLRTESYSLQACLRAYSGEVDPLARLTDVFAMLNALHQEILNDIQAGGALGGPGAWGALHVDMDEFGPLDNKGFGCVLGLQLAVINVQISG